ncbi:MAG: hypothetical protein KC609_25350 [Myxococcales bacterium]|nr:hypothetical protein [Myxococcales bacterium]
MNRRRSVFVQALLVACLASPALHAKEISFSFKSFDGFSLDAKLALPDGVTEQTATRVIVLIHGSGRADMDGDLTRVAVDKSKKLLLYKGLSDALTAKGFAVLRYHKRNYQLFKIRNEMIAKGVTKAPEALVRSARGFAANPIKYFVEDAKSAAAAAKARLAKASVYLLGISEGTYVGLQVLDQVKSIKGIALIGFFAAPLDVLVFEQFVYRGMYAFRRLDKNHDERVDKAELAAGGRMGQNLLRQIAVLDLDKDGALDGSEFRAACLFDWYRFPRIPGYTIQVATYPTVKTILQRTTAKVAFFQGIWDNQTPAYHAHSIKILADRVWKKPFLFRFFPKLGHILHHQPRYDFIGFGPMDKTARETIQNDLDRLFR